MKSTSLMESQSTCSFLQIIKKIKMAQISITKMVKRNTER